MKVKKIRLFGIFVAFFIALSALLCLTRIKDVKKVYAAEVLIENWTQEDGALLGDILEVPDSVRLQIDENTLVEPDSGIIYFPDGNARTLGAKLLDIPGIYILEYQSTVNGKTYVGKQSFVVEESNYYLSNTIFSTAEFVESENLKYGDKLKKRADGIEVSLSKGNYFRFNQPINIYDVAKNNNGIVDVSYAYPIMDTSLTSGDAVYDKNGNITSYWGTRLGSYFTIKLIDCYDESNYIEFYLWSNQSKTYNTKTTYCGAGISGEKFCHLKEGTGISATVEIDGKTYIPVYRERYEEGTPSTAGIYAYGNTYGAFSSGISSFKLNVNTNEIYYGNTFLTDVDHPQVYQNNGFKGFTTGEVYVQFSFENSWTSSPMELYIQSILSMTGDELRKVAVSDTTKPEVEIDVVYTDEVNKSINVEYNKEFTLPTANVYDVNGENKYNLAVYYDYYTDNPKTVYVKEGKFIPNKLGVQYTAVYLASDRFGNKNVDADGKCIDVINISPVKGDTIRYSEDKITSLTSCTVNTLPAINAVSKNKDVRTKLTVISPNGARRDITDSFDGDAYNFIPEYIGEYIVEYEFSDNVYTKIFEYAVNCNDKGNVLFEGKLALPSVFIKDAVYNLNTYFANVATQNGLAKHEAKFLVSVDGGEFKEIVDQHQFKVEGSESLRFKAEYKGQYTQIQTCKITDVNFSNNPNVNDGNKIFENYFVGYTQANYTDSYLELKFDGNKSELLQYATPLVYNAFKLEFEIPEQFENKVNAVSIILREICNDNRGYVITYTKTSSKSSFYFSITDINGNNTYAMKAVSGAFAGTHAITISNSTITTSESFVMSLPKVDSQNIELSIFVPQATGEFALWIKNVCGASFNSYIWEKTPELIYRRPDGNVEVGVEYTLPTFNISSAFTPISLSNLKYSFIDENGEYLLDVNGKQVKDIAGDAPAVIIKPTEVKMYYLHFTYDNFGNAMNVQDLTRYTVAVIDTTPPETKFTDGSTSATTIQLTIGEKHVFKKFTVVDNVTSKENLLIKIVILDEDSTVVAWNADNGYTFKKAGKYRVIVFAEDENGNVSRTYYNVVAK